MYQYSIWIICSNDIPELNCILETYNDNPHIPHVTIETNIPTIKEAFERAYKYRNEYNVSLKSECVVFDQMYENDPLCGWGVYAEVEGLQTDHDTHMTYCYGNSCVTPNSSFYPFRFRGKVVVVDTTSSNPGDWHFV